MATGKGGAERVASELGIAMRKRGHGIAFAFNTTNNDGTLHYPVPDDAPLLRYEDSLSSLRNLRQRIRTIKPDIILNFYANWRLYENYDVLRGLDIPIAFQECSNPARVLTTNWANAANASRMRLDILRNACGIRFTQPQYIESLPPEMRHLAHAFPNAFERAESIGHDSRARAILHVGAFKANKNGEAMLDAFSILQSSFPDWKLIFCTTRRAKKNACYEKLTRRIEEEFAGARVILQENVEDMAALYRTASIHCITSLSEGLPNCVCEAMCQGTPSVGFAESIGTNTLIRHGVNGLLAPSGAEALAESLSQLMSNPGLVRELGENAWSEASRFEPSHVYDEWEGFFEKSLKRAKDARSIRLGEPARDFTAWDETDAQTWPELLHNQINNLSGEVLFFGCGDVYSQFKESFSYAKPRCMLLDTPSGDRIDGLEVFSPAELDENMKSLPVIVFSREARIIAHRLRTQHAVKGEIVCIDQRAWMKETFVNEAVGFNDICRRQECLARGKFPYRTNTVPMTSRINIENPDCAFCGSDDVIQYMTSSVVPWYGGDTFRLVRCGKCGLVYNSPRPAEEYAINYVAEQGEYLYSRKLNRQNVQAIHDWTAQQILQKSPAAKDVFDVAFGAGTLMHSFRKLGLNAYGNEINDFSVAKLREQGFEVFQSATRELDIRKQFDIVTMLDYLEHTYTPFDDLLKAHAMLRPGGLLHLKTLYLGCPPHIQKGELWQLFGIGHFYYFTPKVLLGMIRNAGFEIVDTKLNNLIHVSARKLCQSF